MPKIGVLLSGCGVFDGSEIHEATFTLLAIDRLGAEAVCLAPNIGQHHVVNHLTGKESGEKRNVLAESARIARGAIKDAAAVSAKDLDALILPGGFGAAKNLSTFAFDGVNCAVNADVARLVREMRKAHKPLGFICIAPVIAAKLLGTDGVELTIGNDADTATALKKMGAKHVACAASEIHVDRNNKVVSTPAYMLAGRISEVAAGVEKLVKAVLEMAK